MVCISKMEERMGYGSMGRTSGAVLAGLMVMSALGGAAAAGPAGAPSQVKRSECEALERDEKWEELKKCATELRTVPSASKEDLAAATKLREKGARESKAKVQLEKFQAAQLTLDVKGMQRVAKSFPADSSYAERVQRQWETERLRHLATSAKVAYELASKGSCRELRQTIAEVKSHDEPTAKSLEALTCAKVKPCSDPTASSVADLLYEELQTARINDQKKAVELALLALQNHCLVNRETVILRIGLIAACEMKQKQNVEYFFDRAKRETPMISACPEILKS